MAGLSASIALNGALALLLPHSARAGEEQAHLGEAEWQGKVHVQGGHLIWRGQGRVAVGRKTSSLWFRRCCQRTGK